MRILMLGWEFPPFISGGLGTACYGLTRALDRMGHEILFVLPKAVDRGFASHVRLISPDAPPDPKRPESVRPPAGTPGSGAVLPVDSDATPVSPEAVRYQVEQFKHVEFMGIPAARDTPYPDADVDDPTIEVSILRHTIERLRAQGQPIPQPLLQALEAAGLPAPDVDPGAPAGAPLGKAGSDYSGDVMGDARRYAHLVLNLCATEEFDVIHAHDWMTYPAGMALARLTGKPLVAHIHSTEFDRSGVHVNQQVYDIERRGMHAAIAVIAVSQLTRSICVHRYGLPAEKIRVVYNGVDLEPFGSGAVAEVNPKDRIVLFLGRITMQKGPEYFVAAAKRVLEKIDNVKFLVAGSGDMARRMIELAAEMGIGHKVLFTGFLRGHDVKRIFSMADCYVMPSVSEPFGIAPLEAMSHDVPVIISKQSGVSEVLTHALKVDFWDVDEMANKIVAVLRHPPLSQTLREHGALELRKLTWDGAAAKCVQVYERVQESLHELVSVSQA